MLETKRELCWTAGGAYSEITWDPDTGCAEIRDCDAEDRLIARHEWELFPEPIGADAIAGEHRTFDARGVKITTRTITAPAA
jgi:hypothetical protein